MEEKNGGRLNKYRSPYKADNNMKITVQKKNTNFIEDDTNNCVNCKYSPYGPYNLNGHCVSSKEVSGITYKIINTTLIRL